MQPLNNAMAVFMMVYVTQLHEKNDDDDEEKIETSNDYNNK
jgi:hypothetical protein